MSLNQAFRPGASGREVDRDCWGTSPFKKLLLFERNLVWAFVDADKKTQTTMDSSRQVSEGVESVESVEAVYVEAVSVEAVSVSAV